MHIEQADTIKIETGSVDWMSPAHVSISDGISESIVVTNKFINSLFVAYPQSVDSG